MKALTVLVAIGLLAAFGPSLVQESFYIRSWHPAWVQALSASIAVIVALLLPIVRDIKKDRKQQKVERDEETVALLAIYHEAMQLKNTFSSMRFAFSSANWSYLKALGNVSEKKEDLGIEAHGRFDAASKLNPSLAEKYYAALSLRSSSLSLISLMVTIEDSPAVTDGTFEKYLKMATAQADKGFQVSSELLREAEARSPYMKAEALFSDQVQSIEKGS